MMGYPPAMRSAFGTLTRCTVNAPRCGSRHRSNADSRAAKAVVPRTTAIGVAAHPAENEGRAIATSIGAQRRHTLPRGVRAGGTVDTTVTGVLARRACLCRDR
jgi:hypothetical protein